eukprot:4396749-Karenia_brevis.AAC.1
MRCCSQLLVDTCVIPAPRFPGGLALGETNKGAPPRPRELQMARAPLPGMNSSRCQTHQVQLVAFYIHCACIEIK